MAGHEPAFFSGRRSPRIITAAGSSWMRIVRKVPVLFVPAHDGVMEACGATEADGIPFRLIDTAGLRRKGRVFEAVEKFSVVKTLQAIEDCNVCILVLDATEGIAASDAQIAGFSRI